MRDIKFRGRRIDNGFFVFGSLSMGGGKTFDETRTFIEPNIKTLRRIEVVPETVGQLSGIRDKNGVDVYEGDKFERGGIVVFRLGRFMVNHTGTEFEYLSSCARHEKIVGNIHKKE